MRQALRKVVIVVGFVVALGSVVKAVCPVAEASYSTGDALGTVGIAAGIGAVLGLSTIAFYDSPFSHMKNSLIGAGAGMVVGLGVAAYLLASDADENEIDPEELILPVNKPKDTGKKPDKDAVKKENPTGGAYYRLRPQINSLALTSVPTKQWLVAVQVLELRF